MFYPDLTPYTYMPSRVAPGLLNVGWLDAAHPFERGEVTTEFVDALWRLCGQPAVRTRGFHVCELCGGPDDVLPTATHRGETRRIGSNEIRAATREGTSFAAPDLIFHYVTAHRYRPPEAFIRAVLLAASSE